MSEELKFKHFFETDYLTVRFRDIQAVEWGDMTEIDSFSSRIIMLNSSKVYVYGEDILRFKEEYGEYIKQVKEGINI